MVQRFVGIDLGTTNSTVSVSNLTIHGDIESTALDIFQIDDDGHSIIEDKSIPSALYIDKDGQNYVGRYAKKMNSTYSERVIKESKRYMGKDDKWEVDNKEYSAEQIASFTLDVLRKQVERYYYEDINAAVITIPANFNFQQQQATRSAAMLAGFDDAKIRMIPEPTAALLDFLNTEKMRVPEQRRIQFQNSPKNLMVFDLGGGTCDVSILQVSEDGINLQIQELSISQYMELGGQDFDETVGVELFDRYLADIDMDEEQIIEQYGELTLKNLFESFVEFAERAKMSFSAKSLIHDDYYEFPEKLDTVNYSEPLRGHLPEPLIRVINITKKEYDEMIAHLLYKEMDNDVNIEKPIMSALKNAVIGPMSTKEIDAVFLVGGMTKYPTIKNRIYDIFENRIKPIESINPMLAVSRGAAVYHQQLEQIRVINSRDIDPTQFTPQVPINNTVPNNIFIEIAGGDPIAILEKGTSLPYERIIENKFTVTGTNNGVSEITSMVLSLITAEDAQTWNATKLKDARILFTKPVERDSKVVLKVQCNEDRDVTVTAWLEEDPSQLLTVNIGVADYSDAEIEEIRAQHGQTVTV